MAFPPQGTSGNDTWVITKPFVTLHDGYSYLDGGAGNDVILVYTPGQTLTDAAFAGLSNFESIWFSSPGVWNFVLGANATAAFTGGAIKLVANGATALNVDGSALGVDASLRIYASDAAETLIGGAGNDYFHGSAGDTIMGNGGNDLVYFYNGIDMRGAVVDGGVGANTLAMTDEAATVVDADFIHASHFQYLVFKGDQDQHAQLGANAMAMSGGALTVNALRSGPLTLDATQFGGPLAVYVNGGNHALAGGAGNDSFVFHNVGEFSSSWVDGNGGANSLVLTTSGTIVDSDFTQANNISYLQLYGPGAQQLALGREAAIMSMGSISIDVHDATSLRLDLSDFGFTARVYGSSGNDTMIAGSGTEWFTGRGGSDHYIFSSGDGMDAVMDFTTHGKAGADVLEFAGYTQAQVQAMLDGATEIGSYTWLNRGGGDWVGLYGVHKADLSMADFLWS